MRNKILEVIVGLFMVVGFLGLLFLAFTVSGLTLFQRADSYQISADFDGIGSLKVRAPVQISGVTVGRVSSIILDSQSFRARVLMDINNKYNNIPVDSSANIYTQGILGSNYIAIAPGFEGESLKADGHITTTHSALILEDLIGQLLFSLKPAKEKQPEATPAPAPAQ